MNIAVKQFEQAQTPAPIIPRYNIDAFTANGVIVQIDNERETIQYLVDWDSSWEGIDIATECTETLIDEEGHIITETVIDTPDWLQDALLADVERHLCSQERDSYADSEILCF